MRMLILLMALAILGVITARQLADPADVPARTTDNNTPGVPDVPAQPQGLRGFEQDMDRFVEESSAARRESIDEQTR